MGMVDLVVWTIIIYWAELLSNWSDKQNGIGNDYLSLDFLVNLHKNN